MAAIRVLVAEDSPTARALLVAIFESDPGLTVIGEARDGCEAVELAERLRPDLITMDVHMPRLDGIEATRQIMVRAPAPILIVSAHNEQDVALSLDATAAGALMAIEKPGPPDHPRFAEQRDYLVAMAKAMSQVRVVRRWARHTTPIGAGRESRLTRVSGGHGLVVAIAASTGGPAAVQQVLHGLPRGFPAPILLVQHIATGFVEGFAHWLDATSPLRVRIAAHGEVLRPATVYVAPDDHHLGVAEGNRVLLSDAPPIGGFRPSATYLFDSVAQRFAERAVAVILTGMGDDGVAGLRAVQRAGGVVLAQDEESCVVYGMPKVAVQAQLVDDVMPLPRISERLTQLTFPEV